MKVMIVGGGVSGLAAAFEALKRGHEVTLCEPHEIGGMIATRHVEGFTLEDGPNVLLERATIAQLIDEIGLRDRVLYPSVQPYEQYVWYRGRPHLVPKTIPQFLKSSLFSKSRKVVLPFSLVRPSLLTSPDEDESVLTFFSRLLGEHSTYAVLDPVLKGIYGGDVSKLSARTLFPKLWEAGKEGGSLFSYMRSKGSAGTPKVFTIKGGIATLTQAMWEKLKDKVCLVRAPATSIVALAQQGEGRYRLTWGDGSTVDADRVIVSLSGNRLAAILEGLHSKVAQAVGSVEYASLAMAHVAVPDAEITLRKAFGVLFPGGMKGHLLGVMFKSIVFPDVAPPGRQLLSVVVGGAQAKGFRPSEQELQSSVPELVREHLGVRAPMQWLGARVWCGAIPQLQVGHHRVVEAIDDFERAVPGVAVCGVDRGGVGVSDRIAAGIAAVARVVESS